MLSEFHGIVPELKTKFGVGRLVLGGSFGGGCWGGGGGSFGGGGMAVGLVCCF